MLGLLAILGGCAGAGDAGPKPPPAVVSRPAAPDTVSISIAAPANGETVTLAGRRRSGSLVVTGYSAARAAVRVAADCRPRACVEHVTADARGAWSAPLAVRASPGQRQLAITAGPDDPGSGAAANSVVVLLRGGGAKRPPTRARRPAPRTTATEPTVTVPTPQNDAVPVPAPAPAPPADGGSRSRRVFLVGDSLAEGIATLLPAALPGYDVSVDAKVSRPLATGMQLARAAPAGTILAVSLFTNDDPRGVGRLEAAVRESVRIAGPQACAVWATIVRPPVGGATYAAANARLEALAADRTLGADLRIVPWARQVAANPGWVAGDGVHATPEGYRARARLYADAVRSC